METELAEKVAKDMAAEQESPKKVDAHPGCVERRLTVMDRKLAIEAVESYWRKQAKENKAQRDADLKAMSKITKVKELLDVHGMADYFDSISDSLMDRIEAWRRAVAEYEEAFKKATPVDDMPAKPSRRPPKHSDADLRGPEASYWPTSKIDAMIQDAIKDMDWRQFPAEDVMLLSGKFQIKTDED
jgi:hypothetical protein